MTGAQSLVASLEQVGADVVFGIPGGAILPAYDPLYDSEKVRHILVRHEQGAGHAAEGYAMVTGKVGVCMATSGPGATNLVTPIADAHMDSVPIVAITGQVASAGHRHRRLPGSRHPRHHHADHQALASWSPSPRTSPRRSRPPSTSPAPAGPVRCWSTSPRTRCRRRRPARWPTELEPARLPPGDQAARQAGPRSGQADHRGPPPGALRGRRRAEGPAPGGS